MATAEIFGQHLSTPEGKPRPHFAASIRTREVASVRHHPYFDLWLHDDVELAAILGGPLVERTVLHEWPLSCVQRLRMADGTTYIYKAQAAPSVESSFYARARSPLLVPARILDASGAPAALVLADVTTSQIANRSIREAEALQIAHGVLEQISQIEGELPAVADIRTEERWIAYANTMLSDLASLVEAGTFRVVDRDILGRIANWAESPSVLEEFRSPLGYVHHDLKIDNLLMVPDGYRVIDWQRPIWGPIALDAVTLLASLGIDPTRHVSVGVVQIRRLLSIAWSAQCARRWYPQGAKTYDTAVAGLALQLDSQ